MNKIIVASLATVMALCSAGVNAGGLNVDVNIGIPGFGYGGPVYHPPVRVVERPVVVVPPARGYYGPVVYDGYAPYYNSKQWRKEQKRAQKRWRKAQKRYWDD